MISGLVLANCWVGESEAAETAIRHIKGVIEVYRTDGMYDLIVKVEAHNVVRTREVVRKIKAIPGVSITLTHVAYGARPGTGPTIGADTA